MQVTCPACQSTFPGSSDQTQTCPACMNAFEVGSASKVPGSMKLELQGPSGEAKGFFDRYQLRQMIYAGKINGKEFIRESPGDWQPIYERADLLAMFGLVGLDLVKIQLSSQRIQGWRKSDSAQKSSTEKQLKPDASQGLSRAFQVPKKEESRTGRSMRMFVFGALVLGLIFWKFL
jgi:hypothetical protein